MDAPPADLPDVAQAPPEKVVAYLRYLIYFYILMLILIIIQLSPRYSLTCYFLDVLSRSF